LIVCGGGYGGGCFGEEFKKTYGLTISFDERGVVTSRETGGKKTREPSRGRFLINPAPSAESGSGTALAGVPALRVKIENFEDERGVGDPELIGQKKAAFGVVTDDIYLPRRVSDLVRAAIAAEWVAAGHMLVEDNQDLTVTGRVTEFNLETPVLPSWNAVGTLDVIVKVRVKGTSSHSITRRYQARKVERTKSVSGPSADHFEAVIAACLNDLVHQIAIDVDLMRYLGGKQISPEIPAVAFEMYHEHWGELRLRVPPHKGVLSVSPGAVRYRETQTARHDFTASCADILRLRTVSRGVQLRGRALEIKLKKRTYHLHDAQEGEIERAVKEISAACGTHRGGRPSSVGSTVRNGYTP
jgi:hypothetical protein